MKKITVYGVDFDAMTFDQAVEKIAGSLAEKSQHQIVTPNPEMLLAAEKDAEFKEILNNAWLSVPDGIGILWAATVLQKHPKTGAARTISGVWNLVKLLILPSSLLYVLPERVSGVDLMKKICGHCEEKKYSIFLLGAGEGIAEKVKEKIIKKHPHIKVAGTFSGSPKASDAAEIIKKINEAKPDIVFVAYGAPAQEKWIAEHLHSLDSVKIAMGVGGAFDFLAGVKKRAPKWMQKFGLEWLFRLIQEPRRIKRIYNATIRFPLAILSKR